LWSSEGISRAYRSCLWRSSTATVAGCVSCRGRISRHPSALGAETLLQRPRRWRKGIRLSNGRAGRPCTSWGHGRPRPPCHGPETPDESERAARTEVASTLAAAPDEQCLGRGSWMWLPHRSHRLPNDVPWSDPRCYHPEGKGQHGIKGGRRARSEGGRANEEGVKVRGTGGSACPSSGLHALRRQRHLLAVAVGRRERGVAPPSRR
jgi:hypothetical protein